MSKTDFFWTDHAQATERLGGSYILHNDSAVHVLDILSNRGNPKAVVTRFPSNINEEILLSDKGFNRFRVPLPIGWVNNIQTKKAVFVERKPVRSRQHGFSRNNIVVYSFQGRRMELDTSREVSYDTVVKDPQYQAAIKNDYPPLDLVLNKIKEGTAVAFSLDMVVMRDYTGLRWLYLNTDRVGLFVDTDTFLILGKFSYVKEQLSENPLFTVSNIKEF